MQIQVQEHEVQPCHPRQLRMLHLATDWSTMVEIHGRDPWIRAILLDVSIRSVADSCVGHDGFQVAVEVVVFLMRTGQPCREHLCLSRMLCLPTDTPALDSRCPSDYLTLSCR